MISRRVVLALPAFAFVAPTAAQALWLKVEGPERAFTFELPATPEYKVKDGLHSYSLLRGEIEYVVQSVVVASGEPRAVLQESIDVTAGYLAGGKWTRVDWLEVQGAPAVDATGPMRTGETVRNLLAMRGCRLVSLGLRGPLGVGRFPDAQRFFASLKFAA
jgi:hypothetical protein